jgi:lipopolysaccharide biosynthesis glycosyltransferase
MFRGQPEQLLEWCNFYLTAGASRLYVALDSPSPELVASLPADPRIHWEVLDQETWVSFYPSGSQNVERKQVDAFRWMARRAASEGHEYLAFVDADELILLSEPFTDVAQRFPDAGAFTLPVREMWYAETDTTSEPFGASLAVRASSPRAFSWSQVFGWRAQFLRNGLLGHEAGKTIYRLPIAAGDMTVHQPRTRAGIASTEKLTSDVGGILHFDSGSVATWNAKWGARLEGSTLATNLGSHRQAQQRLFSHALHQPRQDQEKFFREFFSLDSSAQTRLETAGFLERVDVRDLIAGPLAVAPTKADSTGPGFVRLAETSRRVDYQFALVCDRGFVKPTFATMTSVLAHTGDKGSVRFVVLGDGLGADDVVHLRELEHTRFDVEVVFHDVTADLDRDVGSEDKKRATFGRIYLVDYLPEQRTIYLDGDVLATRDFTELFELDLGAACLAGAPDSAALRLMANPAQVPIEQQNRLVGITAGDPLEYLNGGVLILDLDNPDFRSLALASKALVVMQGRALKQRDQDAMNIAFGGRKYRLDSKYNYMTQFFVSDRCLDGELQQLKYDAADASLIHFSGKIKPWVSPQPEFYNGLYRRLVAEAEERVGVSCDFYFSGPSRRSPRDWTAERWSEVLRMPRKSRRQAEPAADVTVVDLGDSGAYLRLSSDMYELTLTEDLRLAGYARGETLFEVPLAGLTPPQAHLRERVGPAVRKLAFDLSAALADCGGVTRRMELVIAAPGVQTDKNFARTIGVVHVLAAGSAASPGLLAQEGADGVVETLSDGWLSGWYRPRAGRSGEALSLYIDGELVAMRPATMPRPDLPRAGNPRGFRFNIAHLAQLGYASGGDVSVRVSGTNIPLRGSPLTVTDTRRDLRYDVNGDAWLPTRRLRRMVRRRRQRHPKET